MDLLDKYTATDVSEAVRALTSMLRKCEKSQGKLAEGTWQHDLMRRTIHALRVALSALAGSLRQGGYGAEDAAAALDTLAETHVKLENTEPKLTPGTPQHTLLARRKRALDLAAARIKQEIEGWV